MGKDPGIWRSWADLITAIALAILIVGAFAGLILLGIWVLTRI